MQSLTVRGEETVDIDILVESGNNDRRIMQFIRIMNRPLSIKRKWNQLSQFRWTSTKVIPIEKTNSLTTIQRWAKLWREAASDVTCSMTCSHLHDMLPWWTPKGTSFKVTSPDCWKNFRHSFVCGGSNFLGTL